MKRYLLPVHPRVDGGVAWGRAAMKVVAFETERWKKDGSVLKQVDLSVRR